MKLITLLAPLEKYDVCGSLEAEITGLSYDSRKVEKGHLFAALPGAHFHGTRFAAEAEKAGATAILSDRSVPCSLPYILVDSPRLALAQLSNHFYQYPSTKLKLYGVTGTNGKTTSTFLLHSILQKAGIHCGILGTIQYSGRDFRAAASLTTPESLDLQRYLAGMVEEKCGACVMEVSSHSLSQHRVSGSRFEAAIFTNLTQDHLDYHRTMEEYFEAKSMLFRNRTCDTRVACINADDPFGMRIVEERRYLGLPVCTYGFQSGSDFEITSWNSAPGGSEIVVRHDGRNTRIQTPLIARYNAYNICGVFAATTSTGIDPQAIIAGITEMPQVPGRLERIDYGQPFLILIDYAHTEDALRQLLVTVRPYTRNKLILLFGCGGERDRGKRPQMGLAAAQLADVIILTSDNPRNENPESIISEIRAGIPELFTVHVHIDREDAIAQALKLAEPGDTLVLAGKGHENYQVIGKEKLHFDEREILQELLAARTQRQEKARS